MVGDDSKINLIIVLTTVFVALAIAGFALWVFFFSPDKTSLEEEVSIESLQDLFSAEEFSVE